MATAVHSAINMTHFDNHANQCIDPDQDFFDFASLTSPAPPQIKRESSDACSITSPTGISLDEDHQVPAKPLHEYDRFKQQTGLPSGSIAGISSSFHPGYTAFSTGMDDMPMMGRDLIMDSSWSTGLPMDASMNMSLDYQPSAFFNPDAVQDDFIDPNAMSQDEAVSNVRVWPGMHQQAALAKAQAAQAQQQRQQQLALQKQQAAIQAQQHTRMHSLGQASRKAPSPLSDARTEETIARVVAQIRADSQSASSGTHDGAQMLPHIIRAKKDEDDMDEDERLLASEEGKKLSSKERRQLRNKVSARAFRSRRKEYIGQLEGEVAAKVNEANNLRTQNRLLMDENARSRAFIERLLRHQAFVPFLEELSCDESLQTKAPKTSISDPVVAPSASVAFQQQPFGGGSQPESTRVGMTMIPETQVDFSMLNLNSNNNNNNGSWGGNSGFGFQQPRVFAVLELPAGPAAPLDMEGISDKGYSALFSAEDNSSVEKIKSDYPVIEHPVQATQPAAAEAEEFREEFTEEESAEFDLYISSPAPSSATTVSAPLEPTQILLASPDKAFAHFALTVSDSAQEAHLAQHLERRMAAMDSAMQRLASITAMFDR